MKGDTLNLPISSRGEWAAKRFYGDSARASAYLPVAYALLGQVKQQMAFGGTSYGHRMVQLPDGVRVRVIRNLEQNIIEIAVPEAPVEAVRKAGPPPAVFEVDFLLVEYSWLSAGGRDLDTRTQILAPFVSSAYGWCAINPFSPYIQWGGDNTSTPGAEAVLIDIKRIREDYPAAGVISVRTAAWWFGQRLSGDITMRFFAWVGGTMVKSTNTWVNSGGTQTASLTEPKNVVPLGNFCGMAESAQELGTGTYNIATSGWTYS
jgi:hypothetical protein